MAATEDVDDVILGIAVAAGQDLFNTVLHQHFSDSESEDDNFQEEEAFLFEARNRLRGRHNQKPPRIEDYVAVVLRFNPQQFQQHFRMMPEAFHELENRLGISISRVGDEGRPTTPVRKQILAAVWILATPDSYRSVAERFHLGKSSLSHCVQRVVRALNGIADQVITWPTGALLDRTKERFRRLANMPNVIGAIDGSHIEIKGPKEHARHYITYKKRFAITLQVVCDADLRFTDAYAGYPGSVGDLRVFRNSPLFHEVVRNPRSLFPGEEYIIGDKAYPVMPWIISAFIRNGILTRGQKEFNNVLAKTRQVIERAFALLKGRFRRLKYLDMSRVDLIPQFILASCVLHNICLNHADEFMEQYIDDGEDAGNENDDAARIQQDGDAAGIAKRNYLVTLLTPH